MLEQAVHTNRQAFGHFSDCERVQALYRCSRDQGRRGQLWSKVTGRPHRLLSLKSVEAHCEVRAHRDPVRCTVSISQIGGSERRAGDFDRDFNPLQDYTRKRWLGIAEARDRGKALPPVSLVQVGDTYFVKDGHHRISVARAFGQEAIEATVVEWKVAGPLPWEKSVRESKGGPRGKSRGIMRAFSRLRRAVGSMSA